jgi:Arc/MetJ-type ribon-helix-helix transcriptional regulator
VLPSGSSIPSIYAPSGNTARSRSISRLSVTSASSNAAGAGRTSDSHFADAAEHLAGAFAYGHTDETDCEQQSIDISQPDMKTIAISIDEGTLEKVDQLVERSARLRNRSTAIRLAIREFAERELKRQSDDREREILHRHRRRLARQARALVREQARP